MNDGLVFPTQIPWDHLLGRDLEECLYWLLDAMGAKDLEWRLGGKGGGAADQGRDLEAYFHIADPDGEISRKKWWVQAKGRSRTVEPTAVKEAVAATRKQYGQIDVLFNHAGTIIVKPFLDLTESD